MSNDNAKLTKNFKGLPIKMGFMYTHIHHAHLELKLHVLEMRKKIGPFRGKKPSEVPSISPVLLFHFKV